MATTQRVTLAGVQVPARHTQAGAEAKQWVEDWIVEHTAVDPPALTVALRQPWSKRRWRKIPARVYPPVDACLNDDIITAGHGWPT